LLCEYLKVHCRKEKNRSLYNEDSEAGGICRLQTDMDLNAIKVNQPYKVLDAEKGWIEFQTKAGDIIQFYSVSL
jgi:hypothetical protein